MHRSNCLLYFCLATGTTALANQTEAENVQLPEDEDEDLEEQVYTQENIDVSISCLIDPSCDFF